MTNKYIYIVVKLVDIHNNTNMVCITKDLNTRYMPVFDTYVEAMEAYPESTILSILWDGDKQPEFA